MSSIDAFSLVLLACYLIVMAWYILKVFTTEKPKEPKRTYATNKKSRKHRRAGKKCPNCKAIIDKRRATCQHCGFKFGIASDEDKYHDDLDNEPEQENS